MVPDNVGEAEPFGEFASGTGTLTARPQLDRGGSGTL